MARCRMTKLSILLLLVLIINLLCFGLIGFKVYSKVSSIIDQLTLPVGKSLFEALSETDAAGRLLSSLKQRGLVNLKFQTAGRLFSVTKNGLSTFKIDISQNGEMLYIYKSKYINVYFQKKKERLNYPDKRYYHINLT